MEPLYINTLINSHQLTIDVPISMLNREVDIFIIPKIKNGLSKKMSVLEFQGKLPNMDVNDFLTHVELQRDEWERNT